VEHPVFPSLGKFRANFSEPWKFPDVFFQGLENCSGDLWSPSAAIGRRYRNSPSEVVFHLKDGADVE
jgi:hypothetical protein